VFVVISFTCTAPLLGILIVQALQGEWLFPFFGMMAFSAGFSAPFFFLAMAPQLMGKLPRAGSWMYAVKVVMALLVVAAAILHVSKADLYWNGKDMLLTREMLLAIWATIAVVCGAYLFGMIKFGDDTTEAIGLGRLGFGTLFLATGLYLTAGLFGRPMNPKVDAFLPPEIGGKVVASEGGGLPAARTETGGTTISHGFSWFEDIEPAMAQAKALGKPLFVDFTGWTCTNCREMEKRMFPEPRVAKLLEGYVRVKLYTDDPVKAKREERQAFQAKHFETIALPTYGLMTPDGKVIASEQYTTDVDRYVRFLERGLAPGAVALAR
jgi:thiol:disulfide interchange protein DsbD